MDKKKNVKPKCHMIWGFKYRSEIMSKSCLNFFWEQFIVIKKELCGKIFNFHEYVCFCKNTFGIGDFTEVNKRAPPKKKLPKISKNYEVR